MTQEIYYYDRQSQQELRELVYGDKAVQFLYQKKIGGLLRKLLKRRFISQGYGHFQDLPTSRRKIQKFVEKFDIKMDEYQKGSLVSQSVTSSYKNFNEFFIRKFKLGMRTFNQDHDKMPAFCEARYLGWEKVSEETFFPVKGVDLHSTSLLGKLGQKWQKKFFGGPLLLARLCPTDYHRFHYPDDGELIEVVEDGRELESVNPAALKQKSDIFLKNRRRISILKTKHCGYLAYIEVGALCVGKIVQTHLEKRFKRGGEKGYFLFGGSTVIVLGEAGSWKPSQDILERTSRHQEVRVLLGEPVASVLENNS